MIKIPDELVSVVLFLLVHRLVKKVCTVYFSAGKQTKMLGLKVLCVCVVVFMFEIY